MCPTFFVGLQEPSYFSCFTGKATPVSFLMGRICSSIFQGWCFHRYAALIVLFLSPKWLFLFELMLLNVGVQPHKMLSLPWAVCIRHHGLIQAKKCIWDQLFSAVSHSQSKLQEMDNRIIFKLQVYSSASYNRENVSPLVERQITSINVIIDNFPDRHCRLATGTDTLHIFG